MLIQDFICGVRVLLLQESEFTLSMWWYLKIFLIPIQVYPKSLT